MRNSLLHVLPLIFLLFKPRIFSIVPIGFGCNNHYRLTFEKSHNILSGCVEESNHAQRPQIISSFSQNVSTSSKIRSICAAQLNTVTLNDDGSVYGNGRRVLSIVPEGPVMSTLVLIFENVYKYVGNDVELICGRTNVFLSQVNNLKKELFAWGLNGFFELGLTNNYHVAIPTKILNDYTIFEAGECVTVANSIVDGSTNNVFITGFNGNNQLGVAGKSTMDFNDVFESVFVADEDCEIKIIKTFLYGVFVVYENNHVYFWGNEMYMVSPPSGTGIIIETSVRVMFFSPYSDIEEGSNIEQLNCNIDVCFVLITENDLSMSVYSWGRFMYFDNLEYMFGRKYNTTNYLVPKEINYGELEESETIVSISCSLFSVFIITNIYNVYAFGKNYGSFAEVLEFASTTDSLKRILSPPSFSEVTSISVDDRFEYHYIFSFVVKDFPLVEVIIIISVVSFVVVILLTIIIGIIVIVIIVLLLLFLRKKKHLKAEKEGEIGVVSDIQLSNSEDEIRLSENHLLKLSINTKLFTVKKSDVQLVKQLGKGGSNSEIFQGIWYEKKIAVKLFHTRLFGGQNDFDEFEREIKIVSGIKHPNIISFYGCCLSPPRVMILMELCENGDLERFLMVRKAKNDSESLTITTKIEFCLHICSGLGYLHSKNIIHRDLKLQNVLVTKNLIGKIIDFGLSRVINTQFSKMTKRVGTSFFMSPEVVLGDHYDYKADVFSFGIILCILLTEVLNPYASILENNSLSSIEIRVALDPNLRPVFDDKSKYSKDLVNICKKCWEHDPSNRMELSEVKKCLEKCKEKILQ